MNEEALSNHTLLELEDKHIPISDKLARQHFDKLTPAAKNDLVKSGCVLFDAPEMSAYRFGLLSPDEQRAFKSRGGVVL